MEPPKSERIEDALRMAMLNLFLNEISGLSTRNGVLLNKQPRRCCLERPLRKPQSGNCKWFSPNVLRCC